MSRVLLISTYELGHQPIHVASPARALRERGHAVRAVDTSVDRWDPEEVDDVDCVAVSVPMHTAMRLALDVARSIRSRRPALPICLYGLYAGVAADHTLGVLADRLIAGEYEAALCQWVEQARCVDGDPDAPIVQLGRRPRLVPDRDLLPPLTRYAHLLIDGEERVAAAVATSHGCASRCRHCPVPAVYDGRIRIVACDTVLDDIDRAVDLGAAHITFADPDLLNGHHHALRVIRAAHRRHPGLTFDLTTKIELILRHRSSWAELAAAGCLFVTTALECVDDAILAILDKGHTATDAAEAVGVLRRAGIQPRPSLLPFTPWTTTTGLADLVDFVVAHHLVDSIDPVQWTMRLLLPDGSLLLARPELAAYLDGYDAERLGWQWHAADPRVDELQLALAARVEEGVAAGRATAAIFDDVAAAVTGLAGRPLLRTGPSRPAGPRLTEAWFCCAEPTSGQRSRASAPSEGHLVTGADVAGGGDRDVQPGAGPGAEAGDGHPVVGGDRPEP